VPAKLQLTAEQLRELADLIAGHLRRQNGLLDRRQLAEQIGLSARSVAALVDRGELPPGHLIGGVRRWSWPVVEQFLRDRQGRLRRKGRGIRKT
jgi:hypothetical protein